MQLQHTVIGSILSWVAMLLISLPAFAQDAEFEPVTVPLNLVKVSAHAYYVRGESGIVSTENQGFNSNAGFVVTEEGVVVFDTLGTPALGKALQDAIREITSAPIKKIIISHYHSDHFYGLQAFVKDPSVEVIAHSDVKAYLASPAPNSRLAERRSSLYPWVNSLSTIVPPTEFVSDDIVFKMGGLTFRVLHVGPAHTAEDLMMLVEEDGVLFAGDILFAGRVPFVGDAKIAPWLDAIRRLRSSMPRVLVGGHGDHSTNAQKDLALTSDYLTFLAKAMTKAVEEGLDFEAAYKATDWSAFKDIPLFDEANRINAYSAFLTAEEESLKAER